MKKLIAVLLSALMLMSMFAGCVADEPAGPGKNPYNLKTVKEGYLTVITSPDYAPYEFYALDSAGNPSLAGFDMALAQYIADYLGLTLEVVPMDFNGIMGEMAAGTADLASTNKAEYEIAAQTGTIQNELAAKYSPNAQLVNLVKATDIIAELMSGKIDGAYVEWDVAAAYSVNYPDLHIVCEVPYDAEGNVIGVKKGNTDLLKYVNEALNKCVDEGTFAQYVAKALEQAAGDNYQGMLGPDGKPTEAPDEK